MENPIISIDSSVQLFLTVDEEAFHIAQQEQCSTNGSSPMGSNNGSLFRPSAVGRGKPIPTEFSRTENQIQTLQENFRKLERLSKKIESDEVAVLSENENFLASLRQWLECERKHDESEKFVEHLCTAQEHLVQNQQELLKDLNVKYLEPINEYVLFTGVVQDVLKRRAQLAETVTNNPSEDSFDQLTIANETIKADVQRWAESKDKEFIQLFHSMAQKKTEFYGQTANLWEQAAAQFSLNIHQR